MTDPINHKAIGDPQIIENVGLTASESVANKDVARKMSLPDIIAFSLINVLSFELAAAVRRIDALEAQLNQSSEVVEDYHGKAARASRER